MENQNLAEPTVNANINTTVNTNSMNENIENQNIANQTLPNENVDFKLTGKTQPLLKEDCIKVVFLALDQCKNDLITQKMNIKESPLNNSLFISNNETTVMIPHEIQNEAITMYLNNNADLANVLGYKQADNTNRQPLIDNSQHVNKEKKELDVYDENIEDSENDEVEDLKEKKDKPTSRILFIVCLLLLAFCIVKKC